MCGRFSLKTPVEQLSEHFQFPEIIPLKPKYNIAPSQTVVVVRRLPDDTDRKLAMLRWGLIPAWVKDPTKGAQPINAMAETAAEKPMFRDAFKRRRCLIPADGFYEWKQEGSRKQPVYIHMKDGGPFAFAGLWEHWEDQEGQFIESCTLLTTEPNELLAQVPNRMPVILDPDAYDDPKHCGCAHEIGSPVGVALQLDGLSRSRCNASRNLDCQGFAGDRRSSARWPRVPQNGAAG